MFTRNRRNRYDKKDSLELGQNAEGRFASLAQANGWTVIEASKAGNIEDHYDFEISKNSERYRVDVKSMKRVSREEGELQDDLIWIEFRTVRNTRGWLFGSADLIAFENKTGFRIVKREDLLDVVNSVIDFKFRAKSPEDAMYKIYSRAGRPDKIAMIKADDLTPILWDEWENSPL